MHGRFSNSRIIFKKRMSKLLVCGFYGCHGYRQMYCADFMYVHLQSS